MKTRTHRKAMILLGVTALLVGACAHSRPRLPAPEVCPTVRCNITPAVWTHITAGHCPPATCPDKSVFVPAHCGNLANGVAFCNAIIAAANCMEIVQANGRIKATATLGAAVGSDRNNACQQTMTGTVIYDPTTQQVVTQFPGQ